MKKTITKWECIEPRIGGWSEFSEFINNIFTNPKYIIQFEYAQCDEGVIYGASFRGGPFNERPVRWEHRSKGPEQRNVLFNSIVGSLSANHAYFLISRSGDIMIDKAMEVLG